MDDPITQTTRHATNTPMHPEEMRASVNLRIGDSISLTAMARTTPAGLVTAGIMASSIVLAVAALIWAVRRPIRAKEPAEAETAATGA
jgi:hypothetical protein